MAFYEFEGKRPYADTEAFVHPQAVLIGDVIVEAGCYIGAGAVLRGDIGYIRVGCEVCSNVLVGMGSVVSDGVKINSRCLIGAGSFVPFGMEIPENSLVMGSPARVIKEISQEQLERISNGLSIYQDLTRRHLKSLKPLHDDHGASSLCFYCQNPENPVDPV